jgi:endonuclease/exonuclease/phosphatase family metal-dependent hydrolase
MGLRPGRRQAALGGPAGRRCAVVRRRIDAVRVTAQLIPALRGYGVVGSADAVAASDHLPVTVEYLPSAMRG